jgi:hypothetical protein
LIKEIVINTNDDGDLRVFYVFEDALSEAEEENEVVLGRLYIKILLN